MHDPAELGHDSLGLMVAEGVMLLARSMRDKSFDPAIAAVIQRTFERVCANLGLGPKDLAAEVVAEKIVELVQCGVRTPTALYLGTMAAFKFTGRD